MIYAPQSQKEAHNGFVIKKTDTRHKILYRKIREDMNIPSHTIEGQPARTHTREREREREKERENVYRHSHTHSHTKTTVSKTTKIGK